MARMRTIKPGFFENDLLAEVDPLGRLLFAGLWTQADRQGRLEDRPKKLKAVILPYDSCDADALLDQLAQRGFIVRYEISGAKYIQVSNFSRHQSPHVKEIESVIPPPPDFTETPTEPEPEDEEIENYQPDTSTVLAPDTPARSANVAPYEPRSNSNMYSNSNSNREGERASAQPSPGTEERLPGEMDEFEIQVASVCGEISRHWKVVQRIKAQAQILRDAGFTIADLQAFDVGRQKTSQLSFIVSDMGAWRKDRDRKPADPLAGMSDIDKKIFGKKFVQKFLQ